MLSLKQTIWQPSVHNMFPNYYNCVLEGRILTHTYAVHAVKLVSVYNVHIHIIHDWLKCLAVRRRSQQRLVAASLLIAKVKITTLRLTTLCLPSSVTFLCNFVYPCLYTDTCTYTNMCTCTTPIQMSASVWVHALLIVFRRFRSCAPSQ